MLRKEKPTAFDIFNILDLSEMIGEDKVQEILSDFFCPKNVEIEVFFQKKAMEFSRQKLSMTYLVFNENAEVAAAFSLAHKVLRFSNESLSKTAEKKIRKFSHIDPSDNAYTVSAFLIAQFSKNYNCHTEPISGNELMQLAFKVLKKVQHEIGGGIVYLECEDRKPLLDFYQNTENHFKVFDERFSDVDHTKYMQLFRFF